MSTPTDRDPDDLERAQRRAFDARWEAWTDQWEREAGFSTGLEVRRAMLTDEPPRVVLGREGLPDTADEVTVSLGRDDGPSILQHDSAGQRLSLRQTADLLAVNGPTLRGARLAVLDGLEQSEAAAGRTPADRAPAATLRERNAERMARQVPAGIRDEDPASLRSSGPRPSR
ncbi:hypothetical protein [Brachybacterium sp. J153]|uniref:hypothetical protein n=1 Tax=Brachybacterium sp. J153 TaxID=3116488 RepID=UPI002E78C455|nr:hypothetical protein [Brachybacterium sp. J153]MEE1616984.1 hypothetical protein [Brachybacterium sp. J153]